MKRKTKSVMTIVVAFTILILLMSSVGVNAAPQAAGTAGTLEIGVTNILGSTPITIRMFDMTPALTYKLNWTGENTGHNFTLGAAQTEHFVTVNIDKPSGSHDVLVSLWGTPNDSALDSLSLYVSDSSIFPDDIILDIGIVLAIVFIMVAVVTTIKRKG